MIDQNSKLAIRRHLLATRQRLGVGERAFRTEKILSTFLKNYDQIVPPNLKTVGLYYAIRGEVDMRAFFQLFRNRGLQCAFPRVDGNALNYYLVRNWRDLKISKFGIGEPTNESAQKPLYPELILVPGVAFSETGYRIGFGAGHYDRAASLWLSLGLRAMIRMIGVAYEFQVLKAFGTEDHDQRLDGVLSETRFNPVRKSSV